ncbi:MAG: DNA adenine methylase [Acidaminococcus sp.]|jgi:DNA adenine methylase|nr:DNA adenine methylase [Acidaminococcus sp.]
MFAKTHPFIKWAGGKRQLLDRLIPLIPKEYNRYFEPFIGGGALLLAVQPEKAIINDTNEQLINIYRHLQKDVDKIISLIEEFDSVSCDKERYLAMRSRYNEKIKNHELDYECAALMIWINKHCFNGLYRVNSKGLFNVPYNNKTSGASIEPDNLRTIGNYFKNCNVEIRQGDFEKACSDVQADDFVYFDSPYVPVSETAYFTSYTKDGFSLDDHKRLAALFRKLDAKGTKIMLSNHNVPLVHELYEGYHIHVVDVRRAINRDAAKRTGEEVIVTNYEI